MDVVPEDYGPDWRDEVSDAAAGVAATGGAGAAAVADVIRHELVDAWDIYGDNPAAVIERLQRRFDEMSRAIRQVQRMLLALDTRAWSAAVQRLEGHGSKGEQ